jgi:Zn-dependent protease with chaperone function
MDMMSLKFDLELLPKLHFIDTKKLWENFPVTHTDCNLSLLNIYCQRHDEWTQKIRVLGLDGGILVDRRLVPGLDRLISHIYNQMGWARPEVYIVSDLGRKGIGPWSAVSVVSTNQPIILLGIELVQNLDEFELAFIIAHESAHLLDYSGEYRKEMSLSFLIRDYAESNRLMELNALAPGYDWYQIYRQIMSNCRVMEMRCDLLGLLLTGNLEKCVSALLTATLKNVKLARSIDMETYLQVQEPLLSSAPQAKPISFNAGHPFMPDRIKMLNAFVKNGQLDIFTQLFR